MAEPIPRGDTFAAAFNILHKASISICQAYISVILKSIKLYSIARARLEEVRGVQVGKIVSMIDDYDTFYP